MSDQAALMRAITDEPDEDVHRLVYADWLEEHGDAARASFIRAQCQLARLCVDYDPFITGVGPRQLLPEHGRAWLAPFVAMGLSVRARVEDAEEEDCTCLFRRGFVESMMLEGAAAGRALVANAQEVFAATPLLHLRFFPGYTANGFSALDVALLTELLALPELRQVRTLDLSGHGLGAAGAMALLAAPSLDLGTRIFFKRNNVPFEACSALEAHFGDSISYGGPNDPADDIPF
jgi:uncharacterized protein (TIGR02996 family)